VATWGEVLRAVQESAQQRGPLGPDLDGIRLGYINALKARTGRAVIVYASGWLGKSGFSDPALTVEPDDVHALMECCNGVHERELDLIVHSPGGSAEAAEQMLNYLRTQFDHIRCIVPLQAKSAATMLALGCDEILLGLHSELGPIDPQILIPVPEGQRFAPAHAILRDFERAKTEIGTDVAMLPAWTPILRGYSGGLLEFCTQQIKLAQEIVAGWLERYMLRQRDDRAEEAKAISEYFGSEASYDRFRTHGRPIRIEELRANVPALRIAALEEDQSLQDAVLSIYHALDLTFRGPAIKVVENQLGRRKVRAIQVQQVVMQAVPAPEQSHEDRA
jgi:Serine dehydrogenase proteinase